MGPEQCLRPAVTHPASILLGPFSWGEPLLAPAGRSTAAEAGLSVSRRSLLPRRHQTVLHAPAARRQPPQHLHRHQRAALVAAGRGGLGRAPAGGAEPRPLRHLRVQPRGRAEQLGYGSPPRGSGGGGRRGGRMAAAKLWFAPRAQHWSGAVGVAPRGTPRSEAFCRTRPACAIVSRSQRAADAEWGTRFWNHRGMFSSKGRGCPCVPGRPGAARGRGEGCRDGVRRPATSAGGAHEGMSVCRGGPRGRGSSWGSPEAASSFLFQPSQDQSCGPQTCLPFPRLCETSPSSPTPPCRRRRNGKAGKWRGATAGPWGCSPGPRPPCLPRKTSNCPARPC